MPTEFQFDVFLSHSSKDKDVVRSLAERLRGDGVRVWFDEWEIRPGDSIPARIEEGMEDSRVLVLCMSANALGSDWAQLESGTFRFRDPLNKERRFIPLRLDETPVRGSLAQFLFIDWRVKDREQEYPKLLKSCLPSMKQSVFEIGSVPPCIGRTVQLDTQGEKISTYAFSLDGKKVLTAGSEQLQLWDTETGCCLRTFTGHISSILAVAWATDQIRVLTGCIDGNVRLWDTDTGRCSRIFKGHTHQVYGVALESNQCRALSCSNDNSIRIWDVETGECLGVIMGHTKGVLCVAWNQDQGYILSGSKDKTMRLWDVESGDSLRIFKGHTGGVICVAWSPDQRQALSGSDDNTLRLWDVLTGRCLRVFEGHTSRVNSIAWSANQRYALSCSEDRTMQLWDVETGQLLLVGLGHSASLQTVTWSADQRSAFSGDFDGLIHNWDLSGLIDWATLPAVTELADDTVPQQVQYTNAKVLLVGESGAGRLDFPRY